MSRRVAKRARTARPSERVRPAEAVPAPLGARGPVLAVAALALGAIFGLHRLIDPDLFQQIAVGRAILADPSSIGVSRFIEAYPAYAYVEDKWLASVAVAIADRLGGPDAVMVYQIALCVLVAGAWHRMQTIWGAAPAAALVGTALGLLTCAFRLEPRPDTISHALLAATIALVGSPLPFRRAIVAVPLLLGLWVNLHGYFVNGLLVLGAAVAARLFADRDLDDRMSSSERALVLAAAIAACLVHPQGWHAAWSPVQQLLQVGSASYRGSIEELGSPVGLLRNAGVLRWALLAAAPLVGVVAPFTAAGRAPLVRFGVGLALALPWLVAPPAELASLPYQVSIALLVMATVEIGVAVAERRLFRSFLLVGFTMLAAAVIRNIPLITPATLVVLGPAWTAAARDAAERWSGASRRSAEIALGALVMLIVSATVWLRLTDRLGTDVRAPSRTGWGLDADRFPVAAADALARAAPAGALLNNFDAGGYLLYRLYPERRVFIAGNTSMYPPSFLEYYRANVTGAALDLGVLTTRYDFGAAIVDLPSAGAARLVAALAADPAWRLAFFDRAGALFVRAPAVNTPPLDVAARVRELVAADDSAPAVPEWLGGKRLPFPSFNLGIFLAVTGRPDLAVDESLRVWRVAPDLNVATQGGVAAQASGRLLDFLPVLEDAAEKWPANPSLRQLLFVALAYRADRATNAAAFAEADADLARMLTLRPGACGPLFGRAKIAVLRGESERARELLAEARAADADGTCARGAAADPILQPFMARSPGQP